MQLWAEVLRVTPSAERDAALAFEIQRGGVEEGNGESAEQRPVVVVSASSITSVRQRDWPAFLAPMSSPSHAIAL
jgi:hypothetical protein